MTITPTWRPLDAFIQSLRDHGYEQLSDSVWDEEQAPLLPNGRFFSYDPVENNVELSIGDQPSPRSWTAVVFFSSDDAPLFTRFSMMEAKVGDSYEVQSIDAPGVQPISVIESTGACLAGWEVPQ